MKKPKFKIGDYVFIKPNIGKSYKAYSLYDAHGMIDKTRVYGGKIQYCVAAKCHLPYWYYAHELINVFDIIGNAFDQYNAGDNIIIDNPDSIFNGRTGKVTKVIVTYVDREYFKTFNVFFDEDFNEFFPLREFTFFPNELKLN